MAKWILRHRNQNWPFHVSRVEKRTKRWLYLLRMFNEHEVTRRSLTPFLLESLKRIKSDYSGSSRQKVYQATCKTAYTPWQSYENQGLPVLQSIFPNAVFSALGFVGRQTQLPMDQRLQAYRGLPIYTRRYVGAQSVLAPTVSPWRNHPTTQR